MRARQEGSLTPVPFVPGPRAPITATHSPEHLDPDHLDALRLALSNLLATDVAEFTYAQIVDGLPTTLSFYDFHSLYDTDDHPAQLHPALCEGVMDQVYKFRSAFDLLSLRFEPHVLQAFQNEMPGSRGFQLRLIELAAVACHRIAAFLFQQEGSRHKREYDAWRAKELELRDAGAEKYQYYPLEPQVPFYHSAYTFHDMYPHGLADVVGYWAEAKIFGGVVLFDRGETDDECNEVFMHGSLLKGPRTIYPLTPDQFQSLVGFLTTKDSDVARPIPFDATELNRPRYDPYHSLKYCHIFRNKWERRLPERFRGADRFSARDYPELGDQLWLLNHQYQAGVNGTPVDEEAVKAAYERMKQISPSSPLWGDDPRYK